MNHQDRIKIDSKDFWNIAGRAGRAFVDIEGKILFGLDGTKTQWKLSQDKQMIEEYFNLSNMENAKSGLLALIIKIKSIAQKCNIDFDLLLQLISENNFVSLKDNEKDYSHNIIEMFNWLDDTLLALDYKKASHLNADPSEWIDDYFRNSLAYIQAENESDITQEEITKFLKARNRAVINMAGDYTNWESIVKSGIPLSSSILIEEYIDEIKEMITVYIQSEKEIGNTIEIMKKIEVLIQQMPSSSFKHDFDENEINIVREQWISGIQLSEIKKSNNGQKICVEYFAMIVPWAINAIVRKLYDLNLEEEAEVLENLAIFSEIGLPNIFAVEIYLSGMKSRVASLNLSRIINSNLTGISKRKLLNLIIENKEKISEYCLPITNEWIEIFSTAQSNQSTAEVAQINNFTLKKISQVIESNVLSVREFQKNIYLCSPDFKTRIAIKSTKHLPFATIKNNLGIYFEYNNDNEHWIMRLRNPNLIER